MPFDDILKSIQNVRDNIPEFFEDAALKHAKEITRLNKENLSKGKLNTGQNITPKYSESYRKKKGFSTPDGKVTGSFYNSIFVTQTNVPAQMQVVSDYVVDGFALANKLEEDYSEDIYSITDGQRNSLLENKIAPEVVKRINDGLKI